MRGGREHAWKRAALLLAAGAAAAGGCAWAVQGKLTTAWYEVPLPAGLEGLDGVKIAQISAYTAQIWRGRWGRPWRRRPRI